MAACPKPQAPERGGKLAKLYITFVKAMPCVCCGRQPVHAHHCIMGRFAQRRASDWSVIPLCPDHHTGAHGLHKSPAAWRGLHGDDTAYIGMTRQHVRRAASEMIGGDHAALIAKLDELEQEE